MRAANDVVRRLYGDSVFHLIVLLAALALTAYAVSVLGVEQLFNTATWWQSIAVWFAVAIVAHDFLLFPLYALADRVVVLLSRHDRGQRTATRTIGSMSIPVTNYLRLPTMAAALFLVMFLPGIIKQGALAFHAATGLTQAPFLGRWLLLTAVFYAVSAICYVTKTVLVQRRSFTRAATAPGETSTVTEET